MRVSHTSLSVTASRLEQDRERDFFRLLYIIDRARLSLSVPVTNVDWKLACDCLDEINYRYMDYAFLLGFTATYVLRNRAGRSFFSRFRLPIYVGLVMYDLELRNATPAPALQYWNSISTLDSEVGRIARVLHTPACFYEAAPSRGQRGHEGTSLAPRSPGTLPFLSWLWEDVRYVGRSLLLRHWCSHVFEGSSWRHRTDDHTEVTALALNNRLFNWKLFESCKVRQDERTEYNVSLKWFPSFAASESIRRSFHCRDLILERSNFGGKLWYKTYFSLVRFFGLEPQ